MMWPRAFSRLERRQESAFYRGDYIEEDDASLRSSPNLELQFYTGMLIEDVGLEILPLSWKDSHPVQIEPQDADFAAIMAFALTARNYSADLTDAVYDFVADVAMALACYNEYVFELVELCDPDTAEVKAFDFCFIQPTTLFCEKGDWVQHVPEKVAAKLKLDRYIKLDPARLLIFHLPESFRDNWMKMMSSLAELSAVDLEFEFPGPDTSTKRVPFDFREHHRLKNQVTARLTKDIGWNMRMYPHDGILEYYWIHRFLQYERFKIETRDTILATLNEGLLRIGRVLGMNGQIRIPGLPTLRSVDQAQEDLRSGQRPAGDILRQFQEC